MLNKYIGVDVKEENKEHENLQTTLQTIYNYILQRTMTITMIVYEEQIGLIVKIQDLDFSRSIYIFHFALENATV